METRKRKKVDHVEGIEEEHSLPRSISLHALTTDAAKSKAVVGADAIYSAGRATEEAAEEEKTEPIQNHKHQGYGIPVPFKDDRPWGRCSKVPDGAFWDSWRRAVNSAPENVNYILSKESSSKAGSIIDVDDPLLPVASSSKELGAGLGARLL